MKWHGTPITKEIKKHSSRLAGGADRQLGGQDAQEGSKPCRQGMDCRTGHSHIHVQISQGAGADNREPRQTEKPRVSAWGLKTQKP